MKYFTRLLLLLLIITACTEEKPEIALAEVNGEILTEQEFRGNFSDYEWSRTSEAEKEEYLQEWINLTLMAQEADRTGISEQINIKVRIANAEKNIKSNALLAQHMFDFKISEDELFDYYKMHKSQYQEKQEKLKIQRIFIREKTKLDSVMGLLEKGLKFTDAARQYSEEAIGRDGGYAGFLSKEDLGENIWNILKAMKQWYYKSVETDSGYYIIRYYDSINEVKDIPFTSLKDEIKEIVVKEKKMKIYQDLITDLKNKAVIVKN